MPDGSPSAAYFEGLYEADADPWRISQTWYEERKRAITMAALPKQKYRRAFEPGCGNGELTALLAQRCDSVIAWDVAAAPVAANQHRHRDHPHVEIFRGRVPDVWPQGTADLILLSEVGYYLDTKELNVMLDKICASLEPGGNVVAVHWRRDGYDHPITGDEVQAQFFGRPMLARLGGYADEDVRIDLFVKTPPEPKSVATLCGLIPG